MGCLCILYYLVLALYSRRLRSTFAVFWLISGGGPLVAGWGALPRFAGNMLRVVCVGGWSVLLW